MTTELQESEARAAEVSPASPPNWGWGRWLWRNLTSMKTAVILLSLLAAAAIPGSLLPQRNVASDPAAVAEFATDHPQLAPWLDRFSLFEVYASPWFAAIYLLLLVSMTGCVLPRCAKLWRAARAAPPAAPRTLKRLENYATWQPATPDRDLLEQARTLLRSRGFRVVVDGDEVRAERGYLREGGNLLFHLSLLVLLFGIAAGRLFGFEGRVALAEGSTFTNVQSEYDAFTPSVWTDTQNLEPFSFRLADFEATFETRGTKRGEPRSFTADLEYQAGQDSPATRVQVQPNRPLDVNETKAFLTGHGYAPRVTVRDAHGDVAFSGAVMFLPLDSNYASDGVIKAPDARPTQLGFEGLFLPTADIGEQGPYSMFPDTLNPQLVLTAFTGDLGLGDGTPQSVFSMDKTSMKQVQRRNGDPFAQALSVGETMRLPGDQGSLTFDGVSRFANFQIAYDPGKEISLAAALMLLVGLTASLAIRRRRVWLRISGDPTTRVVEVASHSLTRRDAPAGDVDALLLALGQRPLQPSNGKDPQP